MKKEYFVISDIHGFYDEMIRALQASGFQEDNDNHILIVCGDIFDRGPGAVSVYSFLRNLPRERRILIRGNHEYLLKHLVERGYPERHDFHNGTVDTVSQFLDWAGKGSVCDSCEQLYQEFQKLPILDWIFSDEWVNYYELDKYIFVHSWIPVKMNSDWPLYAISNYSGFSYKEDWRLADDFAWEEATWGCPIKMFINKLYPEGKTIVCGHWDAASFHKYFEGVSDDGRDNNKTYISENLIALDATTVLSKFCNVYKIIC